MSYRVINAFSFDQRNFKPVSSGGLYSWELEGVGNGNDLIKPLNISLYRTYLYFDPVPYSLRSVLVQAINSGVGSGVDVNDLVVVSPLVDVIEQNFYSFSISALAASGDITFTFDAEFFEQDGVTPVFNPVSSLDINALESNIAFLMNFFQIPPGAAKARLKVTVGGYNSESLKNYNGCAFFDPVICDITPSNISFFSESVYNSIPDFMKIDDEKINEILSLTTPQMIYPLRRYVESLCAAADKIYLELNDFRYDRAVDGVEHKSKLTDPNTTDPSCLEWLAAITGTKLFSLNTGFTPWAAIEAYDGSDDNTIPGQWLDVEDLNKWQTIQSFNPDFFDSTQGYRNQIRIGATGLNAGRPDSIEALVRTMLLSETSDTDVVIVSNEYTDNPFRVKLLVDPSSDPDLTGSLLQNVVSKALSVGCSVTKESLVIDSGRGSYKFEDALYPNTYTGTPETKPCGAVIYGQSFISDYEYSGQNIVLNNFFETDSQPEFGGGVGAAHFSEGSAYYFGWSEANTPGSLTASTGSVTNLGGLSNYEIIAVLTDVVPPVAGVYTNPFSVNPSNSSPASYLFREKRLIACGTDGDGLGNDWALYMVSGLTPSSDSDTRLLFIDGYRTQSKTNYAYSDPIDPSFFAQHRDVCVRFSKQGSSFKFYVQNSIYDDWETHSVGSGSFTPVSSSAGTKHGVQVLGKLDNSDWSDATGLSCAVKRVMIFNHSLVFNDESVVSDSAHAVCNGGVVQDFGVYSYQPTIDIDLVDVSLYAESFTASLYEGGVYGSTTVTVNSSSVNEVDILAMRPHPTYGNLWHFGYSSGVGADTLTVSGLTASATYDYVVHKISPSTGAVDSNERVNGLTGGTSITLSADDFGGDTILAVEVMDSGGTAGTPLTPGDDAVAYFTPSTIGASATVGTDNYYSGKTWTLNRAWPSSGAYSPSQVIDKACIHMYESTPKIVNNLNSAHSFNLEHWKSFSIFLHVKRVWTGDENSDLYDIFNVSYGGGIGLRVFYDGPKIKATYFDGVSTESVEWVESPIFGDWHRVVLRRNGETFDMVVDGVTVSSAPVVLSVPFPNGDPLKYFSKGLFNTWNSRFAIAHFSFFDRYLLDNEIALLESEVV